MRKVKGHDSTRSLRTPFRNVKYPRFDWLPVQQITGASLTVRTTDDGEKRSVSITVGTIAVFEKRSKKAARYEFPAITS